MPEKFGNVLAWGSDLEAETMEQAAKASRLPFVEGHVALMPDAHVGLGATIGSVIPTNGAIIPAAVGVDIGCGMIAAETDLSAHQLPTDFDRFMTRVERAVPAGLGKDHSSRSSGRQESRLIHVPPYAGASDLTSKQVTKISNQFGTLGSGNHFVEVCLDEVDHVWVVLHSGSRGIGNQLANQHIEAAKGIMKKFFITLEDPDLAYLAEGTPQFDAYIADMLWAQEYAKANREAMMDAVLAELFSFVGAEAQRCRHAGRSGPRDPPHQLPSQLHRARASSWTRRLAHPQGCHQGAARRFRRDPGIDGDIELHRAWPRESRRVMSPVRMARAGA